MGQYIVFDGMDGSGKGTQMKLLQERFGATAVFTREPGGTPFAEEIRRVVRDNPLAATSTGLNNFLLFWAAREELQQNLVAPALQAERHVFSDRGDSSTYAFQLWGEQHRELLGLFKLLRYFVFEKSRERRAPDLYIIFDLHPRIARERVMADSAREQNHFDMRDLEYYQRVREGFHSFASQWPAVFLDATRPPAEVHQDVLDLLASRGIVP
ncbi:MAG: dTMP kinase [Patescibacteria group bacterium]